MNVIMVVKTVSGEVLTKFLIIESSTATHLTPDRQAIMLGGTKHGSD